MGLLRSVAKYSRSGAQDKTQKRWGAGIGGARRDARTDAQNDTQNDALLSTCQPEQGVGNERMREQFRLRKRKIETGAGDTCGYYGDEPRGLMQGCQRHVRRGPSPQNKAAARLHPSLQVTLRWKDIGPTWISANLSRGRERERAKSSARDWGSPPSWP